MTKFKPKDKVSFGNFVLDIAEVSAFGNTAHYGFYYISNDKVGQGWIPCEILDKDGELIQDGEL